VRPGILFAALPGAKADGREFIADAVARGAAAVLAPEGTVWPPGVPPRPLVTDAAPRRRLARLAAEFAGPMPAHIAAVTGTNGKTSTVDFLRQILGRAGRRAASLGTLGVIADGVPPMETLTTPDAVTLANTLAALAKAGVTHAALEASSHGLEQSRLDGVVLEAAGFTNLTRDHLDYHGSLEAYRRAKLRLFDTLLPKGAPAVAMADLEKETLAALRGIAVRRGLDLRLVGVAQTRPGGAGAKFCTCRGGFRPIMRCWRRGWRRRWGCRMRSPFCRRLLACVAGWSWRRCCRTGRPLTWTMRTRRMRSSAY
jgi:UDP-N-acetylmuramoyl-L-alanyl-D-glutamate--2,6-diaminopimelate ligase